MDTNSLPDINSQLTPEAFWLEHIKLRNKSGLSKVGYCRKHGLIYCRYLYWDQKLKIQNGSVKLVAVQVEAQRNNIPAAIVAPQPLQQPVEITLLCSLTLKTGAELKIHDAAALSTLIAILR